MKTDKITKNEIKDFLKIKLSTDKKWAEKALLKIFENQTTDEQATESTNMHNNIGFTGVDAHILSSFSKQLAKRGFLTPKQMAILFKKMPKYWSQILKISDIDSLSTLVLKGRK